MSTPLVHRITRSGSTASSYEALTDVVLEGEHVEHCVQGGTLVWLGPSFLDDKAALQPGPSTPALNPLSPASHTHQSEAGTPPR
jgi:hypothetical protein